MVKLHFFIYLRNINRHTETFLFKKIGEEVVHREPHYLQFVKLNLAPKGGFTKASLLDYDFSLLYVVEKYH